LTTIGSATLCRSAAAVTVTRTGSAWRTGYGDPDATGSGFGGPGTGGGFVPHTSLQLTGSRTVGEGASSKMGWLDTLRILMAQWRVFVR
jgi:hypothetical protein